VPTEPPLLVQQAVQEEPVASAEEAVRLLPLALQPLLAQQQMQREAAQAALPVLAVPQRAALLLQAQVPQQEERGVSVERAAQEAPGESAQQPQVPV